MSKESPLEGAPRRGAQVRSMRLGRLVVSGLLALPLLAHWIAKAVGFEVFYLADPKLQAVWGTLAQVVAGWPLYSMALGHLRRGGAGRAFGLCLVSTLLYGISLYTALATPGTGALFLGSATTIVVAYALDYLDARRSGASA
jgi:cation transport ATPase